MRGLKVAFLKENAIILSLQISSIHLIKVCKNQHPKASKSSRKTLSLDDMISTQVLRNLEISLRTNSIEWVHEFLSEECQGLNVLIEYLNSRLQLMRHDLAAETNVDNFGTYVHFTILFYYIF